MPGCALVSRPLLATLFLLAAAVQPVTAGPPKPSGPRVIQFAGLDWTVKASTKRKVGPGPNFFSDSTQNVWVDANGRLHLRITRSGTKWLSAEVVSKASFGHGTYRFFLDNAVGSLDRNVVLGLFTWNDLPDYAHREIDVEFSRWGNAADPTNAQYVVQPYDLSGHLLRFLQPPLSQSTHSFDWQPASVRFRSLAGHASEPADPSDVIEDWTFSGDVPQAGGENARMNLWLFRGTPPANGQTVEVVVSHFEFVP